MFADSQRRCVLVFAIAATLHLVSVNGFTAAQLQTQTQTPTPTQAQRPTSQPSPILHDEVEAEISLTPTLSPAATHGPTTTTLASSNAPATATATTTESRTNEHVDDKIGAAAATMLPELFEQTIRAADVAAHEETTTKAATETTTTTTTTKTKAAHGKATTKSDGNEVKTQIKSTEKDAKTKQELQLMELPATMSPTAENTNEPETITMLNIMAEATKTEALQDTAAAVETSTTPATMALTTDAVHQQQQQRNHVQLEGRLKSGLHRITTAEVADDEVGAVPSAANAAKAEDEAALKVNIADLYPMKKADLEPILRDSNTKLLKERTVFKKMEDEAEYRQNLLPNEVESNEERRTLQQHQHQHQTPKPKPQHLSTLQLTLMRTDGGDDGGSVSDFTGKLLAEQDGVITEIEQKFRLSEFVPSTSTATSTVPTKNELITSHVDTTTEAAAAADVTKKPVSGSSINHKPVKGNTKGKNYASGAHDFIERRVKKSFAFPMHRAASDAMSAPYVDFANTKFTGSAANGSPAAKAKTVAGDTPPSGNGNAPHEGAVLVAGAAHPEFSTTKFYNSKELYNEMVMHNKLRQLQSQPAASSNAPRSYATTMLPGAASRFATLKNVKNLLVSGEPLSASTSPSEAAAIKRLTATVPALLPAAATTTLKPKKFQKELKRAKLLLKAVLPTATTSKAAAALTTATATTTKTTTKVAKINSSIPAATSTSALSSLIVENATNAPMASSLGTLSSGLTTKATTSTSTPSATTTATDTTSADDALPYAAALTTIAASHSTTPQLQATNPTKSASKPIARPRVLSRLQEKINSLECEIQNVPQDSHLWRGNETHELLLPLMQPSKQCDDDKQQHQHQHQRQRQQHQTDCATSTATNAVSWAGEAEIQSGDILIVEINDAPLLSQASNMSSAHNTQVYQVTRSGHEHCDVTEGILLDITPLVVDGRKLVTLYDKDLTEGVNLLIVVSELWGAQCVRLKVTTKTDNCGENADCSGKGVCYSNPSMEEYECQCCTGFAGPHCEEIDACTPSPCTNNGICVDLSQGHEGNSYQCLCPYGYTGKNCQYESDPCNPAECMNGGTCVGNSTHFRCDCTSGFAGPLCQHSLNECESSPCVHGICVDQEDGFRCFCQPGFAGELCNFEYNECESSPCQNGGECIDHIGSFECRCTKGYSGIRCEKKVDFCANKPCPEGHRCIDHGNDFSCECPGGRNGPDCNQMARTRCNVNPCTHGGTCWSSGDSFYCACRPGFTGTMCEDEFVVETVVSSSEFIVDDTSTRNFNDKSFGSSVVLKSPIELHSAYFAAGVLAAATFIVAVVVTICHCKVNQTYRKFSTRTTSFIPIIGFGRRPKPQNKLNKHWLSGKGVGGASAMRSTNAATSTRSQLTSSSSASGAGVQQHNNVGQLQERPFQRHLAMNLENDMYYTVDFSENSQHSPLIQ